MELSPETTRFDVNELRVTPLRREKEHFHRVVLPPIRREELTRTRQRQIGVLTRRTQKLQRMIDRMNELMELTRAHVKDLEGQRDAALEEIGDIKFGQIGGPGFDFKDVADSDYEEF